MLGIYEKAINQKFDWSTKIDIAKAAGFDFIEFSVDESEQKLARLDWSENKINALKEILKTKSFYFNSMALSGLRKFPLGHPDFEIRQKSFLLVKKAIILAKKLGISIIQLAGYDVYYLPSGQKTRKYFQASLLKIAQLAKKYSIMLTLETMDTPFMGTIKEGFTYLEKVNSPWLNLYPDLGNLWQYSKNIAEEITLGFSRIVAFHFKDTKPGVFRDIPWGKGNVDFLKISKILHDLNYQGPFLVEMWSQNDLAETKEQNIESLQKARQFFKQFF